MCIRDRNTHSRQYFADLLHLQLKVFWRRGSIGFVLRVHFVTECGFSTVEDDSKKLRLSTFNKAAENLHKSKCGVRGHTFGRSKALNGVVGLKNLAVAIY